LKLDLLQKMVQDCAATGATPRTIVLTVDDAKALGIPMWTRQLWGLKVVIASNTPQSQVTSHIYDTVQLKKPRADEQIQ